MADQQPAMQLEAADLKKASQSKVKAKEANAKPMIQVDPQEAKIPVKKRDKKMYAKQANHKKTIQWHHA